VKGTLFDMSQVDIQSPCDEGMEKLYDALEFVNHNPGLFADNDLVAQLAERLQRGYARLRMAKAKGDK